MWFKKRKHKSAAQELIRKLEAIPKEKLHEALLKSQELGQRLTAEALSLRELGDYDSAIKYLDYSVETCKYFPAASILGNTLIASQGLEVGLQYFEEIIDLLEANSSPVALEVCANLAGHYRGRLRDIETARSWIHKGRSLAEKFGSFEHRELIIGSIDIEEAYLQAATGNFEGAMVLLQRRLLTSPDCQLAAKLRQGLISSGKLNYYALKTNGNVILLNMDIIERVQILLSRGLEQEPFQPMLLSVMLVNASDKGWSAPQIWSNKDEGKALGPFVPPIEIEQAQAIELSNILRNIPRQKGPYESLALELDRLADFASRGAFTLSESPL